MVPTSKGKEKAEQWGGKFLEVSAFKNDNVEKAFHEALRLALGTSEEQVTIKKDEDKKPVIKKKGLFSSVSESTAKDVNEELDVLKNKK